MSLTKILAVPSLRLHLYQVLGEKYMHIYISGNCDNFRDAVQCCIQLLVSGCFLCMVYVLHWQEAASVSFFFFFLLTLVQICSWLFDFFLKSKPLEQNHVSLNKRLIIYL